MSLVSYPPPPYSDDDYARNDRGSRMLLGAASFLGKTYLYAFGFFQIAYMLGGLDYTHTHPQGPEYEMGHYYTTQTKIKDFVKTYKENNDYFSNYMTEMMDNYKQVELTTAGLLDKTAQKKKTPLTLEQRTKTFHAIQYASKIEDLALKMSEYNITSSNHNILNALGVQGPIGALNATKNDISEHVKKYDEFKNQLNLIRLWVTREKRVWQKRKSTTKIKRRTFKIDGRTFILDESQDAEADVKRMLELYTKKIKEDNENLIELGLKFSENIKNYVETADAAQSLIKDYAEGMVSDISEFISGIDNNGEIPAIAGNILYSVNQNAYPLTNDKPSASKSRITNTFDSIDNVVSQGVTLYSDNEHWSAFSDNLKEAKRQLALADENMNTLRENELQDRLLDIETINAYIESQIKRFNDLEAIFDYVYNKFEDAEGDYNSMDWQWYNPYALFNGHYNVLMYQWRMHRSVIGPFYALMAGVLYATSSFSPFLGRDYGYANYGQRRWGKKKKTQKKGKKKTQKKGKGKGKGKGNGKGTHKKNKNTHKKNK